MFKQLLAQARSIFSTASADTEVEAHSEAYHLVQAYLRGEGADHRGRTLAEVLSKPDDWWEATHDFIQWLFPSTEPSEFNAFAPVLRKDELLLLGTDPLVRQNITAARTRMLRFLGLTQTSDGHVYELPCELPVFRPAWLRRPDHNDYRISRVLACLSGTGLRNEANAILDFLDVTLGTIPEKALSLSYWRAATTGIPHDSEFVLL